MKEPEQIPLLAFSPALQVRPDWERLPGINGGTCGAVHIHISGWKVEHCGHPTANYPYIVYDTESRPHTAPNGGGWRLLEDAKTYVEQHAQGGAR